MAKLTKQEKRKHCVGCEDNFYNGNNPYGVTECWKLASMKLILRKRVPIWQVPPWNQPAEKKPSCYRCKGYVWVGKDVTC